MKTPKEKRIEIKERFFDWCGLVLEGETEAELTESLHSNFSVIERRNLDKGARFDIDIKSIFND
jgi:hypothetical protein